MSAYPSLLMKVEGSSDVIRTGAKIDLGGDGIQRTRKTHPDRHDWTLVHEKLSSTNEALIDACYTANGLLIPITYVSLFDGLTYTARFLDAPQKKEEEAGMTTVTVRLTQAA